METIQNIKNLNLFEASLPVVLENYTLSSEDFLYLAFVAYPALYDVMDRRTMDGEVTGPIILGNLSFIENRVFSKINKNKNKNKNNKVLIKSILK